jgi:hypothetical protein
MITHPARHHACCLLAGIIAAGAVHAETSMLHRWTRALTPAPTSAPLAEVTLDAPLYAECQPDLRDLRLVENGAREVPYCVERVMRTQARIAEVAQPADVLWMRELPSNTLEIVFALQGQNPSVSGLRLATPLRDFERAVSVFMGETTQAWQLVMADALLFDYSRYMDVAQHALRLPATVTGRFLKVVISDVTDETRSALARVTREWQAGNATATRETVDLTRRAFRIDRVDFWREVTREAVSDAVLCDYPVRLLAVTQDVAHGMTIVDINAGRAPLTMLTLHTPDRNFRRRARLYANRAPQPEQTPVWSLLAETTLASLELGPLSRSALAFSFPETRVSRYRIEIHNDSNPLLNISGVAASGTVYRLLFLPRTGAQYALRYGAPNVVAPRYDLGALLADLATRPAAAAWQMAAPVEQTVASTLTPWWTAQRQRVLLIGALVAVVAVLAWALWYAARRVQHIPPES